MVVATQIFFYFDPECWGRWTHFDEHIFQLGWFNHHLVGSWRVWYYHPQYSKWGFTWNLGGFKHELSLLQCEVSLGICFFFEFSLEKGWRPTKAIALTYVYIYGHIRMYIYICIFCLNIYIYRYLSLFVLLFVYLFLLEARVNDMYLQTIFSGRSRGKIHDTRNHTV